MLWRGFQRPKRLEFERDTLTDRFGRFTAQPFERGFGTTVGNAMRRVLLSSIEGAAVTAVKIDGVLHEFSPIKGVVEDATDIILNLKMIPLKVHTDAAKTLTLRVNKAGKVKASDIEDLILGCAMPEGEQGLNIARIAGLLGGLPEESSAMTINRFCSSGLQAIALAAGSVALGSHDFVIAGGVESMSMVPMTGNKLSASPEAMAKYASA